MEGTLLKLINELNLSINGFSKSTGISADTIYNITKGKYDMSPYIISRILEKYPQVRKEWLLTGEGAMFGEIKIEDSEIVRNLKEENRKLKIQIEELLKTFHEQTRIIASLIVNKKNNH